MKSALYKNRWTGTVWTSAIFLALCCCTPDFNAKAIAAKTAAHAGVESTIWALEKEASRLTLITLHGDPIPVAVRSETLIAGICVHCNLVMEIPVGQIAKNCTKCACSSNAAECFVNKVAGKKSWADLLNSLPKGTTLLAEYVEPGKPESGVKRLTIDPKTALLPIRSASPPSLDAVTAAAKGVGGTSVELGEDGKRLLIHLKSDWSQDREIRLAKLLAPSGVEVAFPSQEKGAN
ncbi:MAG: hypothetical protein JWL77_1311 [Chthonomonadaceae bacterium]|nr:hypothetical protein [Chthonomonadaceae bacterium]